MLRNIAAAVLAVAFLQAAAAERRLAPLPRAEATWSHGPFESGECAVCHERGDAKDPGPALGRGNQLCFDCHDDFPPRSQARVAKYHSGAKACTGCHNPHNSRKKSLLL